ncbi:DUF6783 domain-containing protein [[Clostridium] symbiosum]
MPAICTSHFGEQSPTKCDAHLTESSFQTCSSRRENDEMYYYNRGLR